jgi:hypothetical protein
MSTTPAALAIFGRVPRRWALWYGYMGSSIAWLLHLIGAYAIAEFGCVAHRESPRYLGVALVSWMLLGLTAVLMTVASGSLFIAAWNRRRLGEAIGIAETESFLMRSGTYLGIVFLLIILVQAIPIVYYLEGC